MSGDSRKEFILAAFANFFDLEVNDPSVSKCYENTSINNFLDDGNVLVLVVRQGKGNLIVSNRVSL